MLFLSREVETGAERRIARRRVYSTFAVGVVLFGLVLVQVTAIGAAVASILLW